MAKVRTYAVVKQSDAILALLFTKKKKWETVHQNITLPLLLGIKAFWYKFFNVR